VWSRVSLERLLTLFSCTSENYSPTAFTDIGAKKLVARLCRISLSIHPFLLQRERGGVAVLSYGCRVLDGRAEPVKSFEHSALGEFAPGEVGLLCMPGR
jgi:hypothetical protein